MSKTLQDIVDRRFQRQFVGRAAELAALEKLYEEARKQPRIAYIEGPGGVGKTSLARYFLMQKSETRGKRLQIDGACINAHRAGVTQALSEQMNVADDEVLFSKIGIGQDVDILLIDSFDKLSAIYAWLFNSALPTCGPRLLVILASRETAPMPWRTDPGWQDIIETIRLSNFSHDEISQWRQNALSANIETPELYRITAGIPLALALLAEIHRENPHKELNALDTGRISGDLAEVFISEATEDWKLEALYLGALVPTVTENLLRQVANEPAQASSMFQWLADRTFVIRFSSDLVIHDLVKSALFEFLCRTHPEVKKKLSLRVADALLSGDSVLTPEVGYSNILAALYCWRERPAVRDFAVLDSLRSTFFRPGRRQDVSLLKKIIADHECETSAREFERWYKRQPDNLFVVCNASGDIVAFYMNVELMRGLEYGFDDPILQRSWEIYQHHMTPDPNADMGVARWWMTTAHYHEMCVERTLLMMMGPSVGVPRMATLRYALFVTHPAEEWTEQASNFLVTSLPDQILEVGGYRYGFGYVDQHRLARDARFNLYHHFIVNIAGVADGPADNADHDAEQAGLAVSRKLNALLRKALAVINRPADLANIQLAQQDILEQYFGGSCSLDEMLRDGLARMSRFPGYHREYEILEKTYLRPEGKQRAAANALGLPYGTYRYQLRRAVDKLGAEMLASLRN